MKEINTWEYVSGEDAMQIRVSELCDSGTDADDILVFDADNEINNTEKRYYEKLIMKWVGK